MRIRKCLKRQEPQSETSRHDVPLPRLIAKALQWHEERMEQEGNYRLDGPVFCTRKGTEIHPRNLNHKLEQLRRRAGRRASARTSFATRSPRGCWSSGRT